MGDSRSRSQDTGHQFEAPVYPAVDLLNPQTVDSLEEFPPESLELYTSTPSEGPEEPSGLIAFLPATPTDASEVASDTPSPQWHRRPGRLRRISASVGRHRTRGVAAVSRLTARVPRIIRAATAGSAVRVRIVISSIGASPRSVAAHLPQQLRTHGARPRKVADPALSTSLSLARQRRRARIRRAITEAAGRDSMARIATITQLAPLVARVVAASSASFALRLRRAAQPLAASVYPFAVSVRHAAGHAVAASSAQARVIAAALTRVVAASSARIARQLGRVVPPLAASVHARAVSVRNAIPQAVAAVRVAGRTLHPRSVAAAAAMLALIIIARPQDGLSDMSARFAVNPPTSPAATATTAIEPVIRAPILVGVRAPIEDARPAGAVATTTAAARVLGTVPENRDNTGARIDPRAIQAVLNRYRDALSTLDVTGVRAVWPSADVGALRKQFAGVRDQNVEFEACRISSVETGARASCAGVIESGFRAGDRRPRVERRRWQFELRKFGEGWRITEVQTQG